MKPLVRLPIRFRWTRGRLTLAIALACSLFVWVFDWAWFRPLIQHYVYAHSGRSLNFDELHIGLNRSLEPTVQVRGLFIENAAWAGKRPLVRAGQLTFVFSWRSFSADRVIVTRVDLVDAEVDLERQADGLRNWRLSDPEDRGPPRIKVLSLNAQRSELRFVHGGLDLDLDTHISTLEAPQVLAGHPDLPLTKWLVFKGTRLGQAFAGQTALSDVLTFADTATPFSLRGQAQTGHTRLEVEGICADFMTLAELDVDIHLAANSLAELRPIFDSDALPASRSYVVAGHLNKIATTWTGARLHVNTGHSDLSGDVSFANEHEPGRRPVLRAALRSASFDPGDIGPLIGMGASASGDVAGSPGEPASAVMPQRALGAARLQAFDAEIELRITRLNTPVSGSVRSLRMLATLRDGMLKINPFDLGVAGGHATGTLLVDSAHTPAEIDMTFDLHGLRLEELSPSLAQAQRAAGELRGRIALRSRGDSIAALAGAASGSVSAELSGASISNRLDAKLGLDGGGLLRALFIGTEQVPVQCARLVVDFKRGNGEIRHLLIETERTALAGRGSVDLARESLDVVLTPHPKKHALLALHRGIHVRGPFSDAKVSLVEPDRTTPSDQCEIRAHLPDHRSEQNR